MLTMCALQMFVLLLLFAAVVGHVSLVATMIALFNYVTCRITE